jgi:cob(I)alamin adenosyltransferase
MSKFKPQHDDYPPSVASTPRERERERKDSVRSTTLYSGDPVSKSDKILTLLGMFEELICYLGIIKAEHFEPATETKFDIDSSTKMFLTARFTQIQETLIDIQASIGTTKKALARFDFSRFKTGEQRIGELVQEIGLMSDVDQTQFKVRERPLMIIPGTLQIEAQLLYARSLCRKVERQLCTQHDIEDICISYMNKLSDYLITLSIHLLHMKNKEPLRKLTRSNK